MRVICRDLQQFSRVCTLHVFLFKVTLGPSLLNVYWVVISVVMDWKFSSWETSMLCNGMTVTLKMSIYLFTYLFTYLLFTYLFIYLFIYLFRTLCHFQHCTGHMTTGSYGGRGNQYIQLVRALYCKLLTIGKQLSTFPHNVRGLNLWTQRWEASVTEAQ